MKRKKKPSKPIDPKSVFQLTDPDAKCKMLKIAETYEQLSVRAVQRLRHHSSATIRNWRR
jgi:hypothetical protein